VRITFSSTITLQQMKTIEIKGSFRTDLGKKSSKQIRKAGGVPCVIYGKEKNLHFHAPELSFKNLIYTPEAHLVKLVLDDQEINVVLKDIQYHPVSDKILHADFIEIFENKPVIMGVPIKITGDSVGVIAGGKLSIKRRSLKIKGLPKDLPEHLTKSMVLTIATSRVAAKSEEEVAAEAATEATNAAAHAAAAPAAAPAPEK
jgi:large subunit ribosomal protein L25